MSDDEWTGRLKLATLIILGVVIVTSIIGLTVVAIFTSRDLTTAERYVFAVAVITALTGGLTIYVERVRLTRRDRSDDD